MNSRIVPDLQKRSSKNAYINKVLSFSYLVFITGAYLYATFISGAHYSLIYFVTNFLTLLFFLYLFRLAGELSAYRIRARVTISFGIFLMLNSTVASTLGGLMLVDTHLTSIISSAFFNIALLVILFAIRSLMSELTSYQHTITESALRDPHTGLRNQRALYETLSHARNQQMVICMVRLSGISELKKLSGYEQAHIILKDFARVLSACESVNISLFRFAETEFTCVMRDEISGSETLSQMRNSINHPLIACYDLRLSIGVSQKNPGQSAFDSLRDAMEAVSRARLSGSEIIIFSPS